MFPADEQVSVHVIDGAGHRLIEFQLGYHETADMIGYDGSTVGPTTVLSYERASDDEEAEWSKAYFLCKTCRDRGDQFGWVVTIADVRDALLPMWEKGKSTRLPDSGRVAARPVADDDLH